MVLVATTSQTMVRIFDGTNQKKAQDARQSLNDRTGVAPEDTLVGHIIADTSDFRRKGIVSPRH